MSPPGSPVGKESGLAKGSRAARRRTKTHRVIALSTPVFSDSTKIGSRAEVLIAFKGLDRMT